MSAVVAHCNAIRALIFTDAASYNDKGMIVRLADKFHLTKTGKLVVTGRGNSMIAPRIADALGRRDHFDIDLLVRDQGGFFEAAMAVAVPAFEELGIAAWNDLWVAGWSQEDRRPKIVQWTNAPPEGTSRFSIVDHVMAPDVGADGMVKLRATIAAKGWASPAEIDWRKFGPEVIKEQRYLPGLREFQCEGQFVVGGHISMTEVTGEGIRSSVVHRWDDDQIGARIRPEARLDREAAPNAVALSLARKGPSFADELRRRYG